MDHKSLKNNLDPRPKLAGDSPDNPNKRLIPTNSTQFAESAHNIRILLVGTSRTWQKGRRAALAEDKIHPQARAMESLWP
jgi:hypothetical protein